MDSNKSETGKPVDIGSWSLSSARTISTCMSITGAVFLPSGKLVLCGIRNVLLIYSKDLTNQTRLDLSSSPWDAARVGASGVIVSLPDEKILQCVTVEPNGRIGNAIHMKRTCWGLDVIDDVIYVCVHDKQGQAKIKLLTIDGIHLKSIGTDLFNRSFFIEPYFVRVVRKDRSGATTVCVTDFRANTVTCISDSNDVISQRKLTSSYGPSGLLLDQMDNILVCGALSNSIAMVSKDGDKLQQNVCVTEDYGLSHPICLTFRRTDRRLIVGMLYQPYCMVYTLSESGSVHQ